MTVRRPVSFAVNNICCHLLTFSRSTSDFRRRWTDSVLQDGMWIMTARRLNFDPWINVSGQKHFKNLPFFCWIVHCVKIKADVEIPTSCRPITLTSGSGTKWAASGSLWDQWIGLNEPNLEMKSLHVKRAWVSGVEMVGCGWLSWIPLSSRYWDHCKYLGNVQQPTPRGTGKRIQ